jgi:hypothetical protein
MGASKYSSSANKPNIQRYAFMEKTALASDTALSDQSQASSINLDSALVLHPKTRPIIVDFDGTLLLRNSTEAYLDAACPRQIAAFLLAFLDMTKPWRLLPGANRTWIYSDWIRMMTVTVLLPWSPLLWRRRAPSVARLHVNASLLDRLAPWPAESVSVARPVSSRQPEPAFEQDGELGFRHVPFARRHSPFFLGQVQHEKKKLQRALVGGEMAAGANRSPQFGVQRLDCV